MAKYTYSIAEDFSNGVVSKKLADQIESSAISTHFTHINTKSDDCDVYFSEALTSGEEDTLDGLVAAHDGIPYPEEGTADGESSTTSESFQLKYRLSTTLDGGTYLIHWYYEFKTAHDGRRAEARILLDSTTEIGIGAAQGLDYMGRSGWYKGTFTAGAHTIDLEYRRIENTTAYIRRVRFEINKVA